MNPNPSPIFEDGKLKPGIYKIQNIYAENYIDIELHSREMCCRPAKNLGEGRGLVSWYLPSTVHVSDDYQWEIKQFGPGYTVQVVSPFRQSPPQRVNDTGCSIAPENPNSSVPH